MPLMKGKSPASFEHNIKAEINAGKPQKQALAIAYATKRKAEHMAKGGMCAHGGPVASCAMGCGYAKGGEVMNEKLNPHHEPSGIVAAIMKKRMMAMGGAVDEGFLDDEVPAIDMGEEHYPDDYEERSEVVTNDDPMEQRKKKLAGILASVRARQMEG